MKRLSHVESKQTTKIYFNYGHHNYNVCGHLRMMNTFQYPAV